jgi:HSP20 family molecular chaperone IbpA
MDDFFRNKGCGHSLDDLAGMAREFGMAMGRMSKDFGQEMGRKYRESGREWTQHHPDFAGWADRFGEVLFPPVRRYAKDDGSLVLEIALAGYDQSGVSIAFQGDYLALTAKASEGDAEGETIRRKYKVPAEEYAQDLARAVYKNGLLTVTIPAKEPEGGSVKIEIEREGN